MLCFDSRAAIFDNAAHRLWIYLLCSDADTPVHNSSVRHGLRRINYQIHDNLLQLSAIDHNIRQAWRQIERN
jgi:hypothetical protein